MNDILDPLRKLLELTFRNVSDDVHLIFKVDITTYFTNDSPVISHSVKRIQVLDEEYNTIIFDSDKNLESFILGVISTIATFDIKVDDKKMRSFYADVNKIHDIQSFVQFLFVRECLDLEDLNLKYEEFKNDNRRH